MSRLSAGIVAGLLAAVSYGLVLQLVTTPVVDAMPTGEAVGMGEAGRLPDAERESMILMVARVARSDSLAVAWALLLVVGAGMGAVFAAALDGRVAGLARGLAWGVAYGALCWLVATLILMPLALGLPALSPLTMPSMRTGAFVGLAAYALAGAVLGASFLALREKRKPPGA